MRKDNEELRNLIRGKFNNNDDQNQNYYNQSNLPTLNNDNNSTKNFGNNLNQTNIQRVNKYK